MTQLPFIIEHCGHCALRTLNVGRGDRCYILDVKDVSQEVKEKKMHEYCPLRKSELIFKIKS